MSVETPDDEPLVDPRRVWAAREVRNMPTVPVRVDAICVECRRTVVKTTRVVDPRRDLLSFQHACHGCHRITWWNPVKKLPGIRPEETQARIDRLDELEREHDLDVSEVSARE